MVAIAELVLQTARSRYAYSEFIWSLITSMCRPENLGNISSNNDR